MCNGLICIFLTLDSFIYLKQIIYFLWVFVVVCLFLRQAFFVSLFWNSLCSPEPRAPRDPPAVASQALGLKVCATMPGWILFFIYFISFSFTESLGKLKTERSNQI